MLLCNKGVKMKLVIISDSHGYNLPHEGVKIPDGDVLIHCGDMLNHGTKTDLIIFTSWFESLPHRHKIVIAGNHDICLETYPANRNLFGDDVYYLHNESVIIDDISFWGSPYTPEFNDWAFNIPRGDQLKINWAQIPIHTDVVITHGPPMGILDRNSYGIPCGCEDLKNAIERIEPMVHCFGHVHEAMGSLEKNGTTYINASICDGRYRPVNPPVEIDI